MSSVTPSRFELAAAASVGIAATSTTRRANEDDADEVARALAHLRPVRCRCGRLRVTTGRKAIVPSGSAVRFTAKGKS